MTFVKRPSITNVNPSCRLIVSPWNAGHCSQGSVLLCAGVPVQHVVQRCLGLPYGAVDTVDMCMITLQVLQTTLELCKHRGELVVGDIEQCGGRRWLLKTYVIRTIAVYRNVLGILEEGMDLQHVSYCLLGQTWQTYPSVLLLVLPLSPPLLGVLLQLL
jgi:hypothetical protein